MALDPKQTNVIVEMARLLYGFLPGSGAPHWQGHVSFATVARQVGVEDFWPGGSKEPAIVRLLQLTLERRPQLFTRLVTEIVNASLAYRRKQNAPLARDETVRLNGLLLDLGFKVPELRDEAFLNSLPAASQVKEGANGARVEKAAGPVESADAQLLALRDEFSQLASLDNRGMAAEQTVHTIRPGDAQVIQDNWRAD